VPESVIIYSSEMETVISDHIDRGLVDALRIDGRAPFRRIAEVLDVSEQTVARRYRRLRAAGVLRVAGMVAGPRVGYVPWTIRLRCTPDAAGAVAAALAKRPDTSWVYLLSGGTEICCNVQARSSDERDALLLDKLPRTSRVLAVSAHLLLRAFVLPVDWAGFTALSEDQAAALRPTPPRPGEGPAVLDDCDRALLGALARDGRMGFAELAEETGWSESTARRRMAWLRESGVLTYQLDIEPAALGYVAEARLWISVRPSALTEVADAVAGHPEVSFAAVTTGSANLVVAVHCRSTAELYRYVTERISALNAIRDMETAPVIRTVKRIGSTINL
jgi:DNA-binding Lrp family transcriptional regulator